MTVKEHYDTHLGNFYSWMAGDFDAAQQKQQLFFEGNGIVPASTSNAIDLGAGHGIQSVSLARLGFRVKAIDFNEQLLQELRKNTAGMQVDVVEDDIKNVGTYAALHPELVVCCGDTILHLESEPSLELLVKHIAAILVPGGKILFSFRDYSKPLVGDDRFIRVKADDTRILTCCLEYEEERVRVTDLLHFKDQDGWQMKVSSYYKIRASPERITECIMRNGMDIIFNEVVNRMVTVIAIKQD